MSSLHYVREEKSVLSLYDDLGVARGATPEEIRAAHKALARLLHPDRIQDEVTRQVAETTLKKINSAFAVLSDSRRRMAYDRELDIAGAASAAAAAAAAGERKGQAGGGWQRWVEKRANWDWAKQNALWGAGTVAGLSVIYLTLWQGAPAARRTAAAPMPEAVKAAPKVGKREKARVRAAVKERVREPARVEVARAEMAAAPAEKEKPAEKDKPVERARAGRAAQARAVTPGEIVYLPGPVVKKPVWIAPPEVKRAETELIAPPEVVAGVATPLPAVVKPGMAGLWVYLKPSRVTAAANSYPPEFIELTLRETGGVVKGRYSARYQVADRPISPEVRFQFEGAAGEEAGEFVWSGNGGAKGEVRLRRVGDHQLHVSWHTTEAGAEAGLSSGTATLIRRQTP